MRTIRILAVSGALLLPEVALAQSVFVGPWPQARGNSCQSYALAYSLGRASAPGFSTATPSELRAKELEIRNWIEKSGKPTSAWSTWQSAVCALTNKAYSLRLTTAKDEVDLYEKIAAASGRSQESSATRCE